MHGFFGQGHGRAEFEVGQRPLHAPQPGRPTGEGDAPAAGPHVVAHPGGPQRPRLEPRLPQGTPRASGPPTRVRERPRPRRLLPAGIRVPRTARQPRPRPQRRRRHLQGQSPGDFQDQDEAQAQSGLLSLAIADVQRGTSARKTRCKQYSKS